MSRKIIHLKTGCFTLYFREFSFFWAVSESKNESFGNRWSVRTVLTEHIVTTGGVVCFVLPVHNESMGDDDFVQVVLIVSGDAEEVQLVALLIISDLETTSGSRLNNCAALRCIHTLSQTATRSRPMVTPLNLSTTCSSPHTRDRSHGGGGGGELRPPAVSLLTEQPHPD